MPHRSMRHHFLQDHTMPSTHLHALTRPRRRAARPFALALAVALVGVCAAASAQQAKPIEQDMNAEEFKAAGLDKLTPEELARLNAWLGRRIETAAVAAETLAKDRIEQENRGFLPFGSSEPIVARMQGDFRGFQRGREYTLDNGQVWRQVDDTPLVGVRLTDPGVRITPSKIGRTWYLAVDGFNTRAKVERVR